MPLNFQDIYFVIALVAVGSFAGYASGLFGIGGGLILVPFFLILFPLVGTAHQQVMHCAVGTSLALVLPNCWASVQKQYRLGNIDIPFLKTWLPFVVFGALLGLLLINLVPTTALKIIFNAYLYAMFFFVLLKGEAPHKKQKRLPLFIQAPGGATFGALSVLLGVGGGTFTVPFLKLFNYPLRRALAVSSATGLVIGVVGTTGIILSGLGVPGRTPYSLGFVSVLTFALVTPMALWFAPRGVNQAHILQKQTLQRLYALLLLAMAIIMTWHVLYAY